MHKLSIIVPVYKVEDFLERCVNSILSQSYHNIEVILVDDGSPDRCPQICDAFANSDCRVRVIHKVNGGLGSARNTGLEVATGEYITFVDSDDWIDEGYSEMMKLMIEYDLDIIGGGYRYVRPWKVENKILEYQATKSFKIYEGSEALMELYFGAQQFAPISIMVWNKIYKRNAIGDLRFTEQYIHEDVEFTPKVLFNAKKVGSFQNCFYNYNIHRGVNSTSGMGWTLHKTMSHVAMTGSAFEFFQKTHIKRISERCADIYVASLLNASLICWQACRKDEKWLELKKHVASILASNKNNFMQMVPNKQLRLYYTNPTLFCISKRAVQKTKVLKYNIFKLLTGKN